MNERTEQQQWRRDMGLVLTFCIGSSAAWMAYLYFFAERLPS